MVIKNKFTFILLILILIAAVYFIFTGLFSGPVGNGTWECVDGEWTAVGKPSAPKPLGICTNYVSGVAVLKYQPMQCVENAWELWFKERSGPMDGAVPSEMMLKSYLESRNIRVTNVVLVETDDMVCTACDICPTTYRFEVSVLTSDKDLLLSEGWVEKSAGDVEAEAEAEIDAETEAVEIDAIEESLLPESEPLE